MRIALTQMNPLWEAPEANRELCRRLVQQAADHQADWILFPEMTLTGFTMRPEFFSESADTTSATNVFFQTLSLQYKIGIGYGSIVQETSSDSHPYCNQLRLVQQGVSLLQYNKIHPFSYGEEANHYHGGTQIQTAVDPVTGTAVSGFICYDLRFPEIFQIASQTATVIFVIANWPESRISHWHLLLQARAVENQCYIAGINRTGSGGGIQYIASSVIYDPYGQRITPPSDAPLILADIEPDIALQYRRDFPLKEDRRPELYISLSKK